MIQVYQAVDDEAPFGVRESTRATRNGFEFRNPEEAGLGRRYTRSHSRNKDLVSVGRDVANGPGSRTVREVHRKLPSQCKSTQVGGDSPAAPIGQNCPRRRESFGFLCL